MARTITCRLYDWNVNIVITAFLCYSSVIDCFKNGYILTILHLCLGDFLGHQSCGIPNREYLTPNQLPGRYVKPNCWYEIFQTCEQMVQWFHLIKPLLVIALENKMNCHRAMLQTRVNTFGSTTNNCCYCKEMGFYCIDCDFLYYIARKCWFDGNTNMICKDNESG